MQRHENAFRRESIFTVTEKRKDCLWTPFEYRQGASEFNKMSVQCPKLNRNIADTNYQELRARQL